MVLKLFQDERLLLNLEFFLEVRELVVLATFKVGLQHVVQKWKIRCLLPFEHKQILKPQLHCLMNRLFCIFYY